MLEEYATGDYDVHFWYAVGHMAEAESECMGKYPELASAIREERIAMIDNNEYFTDFEPLIQAATILSNQEMTENVVKQESDERIHQEKIEEDEDGMGSNSSK